eukprot:scaffold2652_cov148-Skeletonema_marinoi.AAC.3
MTSRWPTALDQSLSTIDLYESHTERTPKDWGPMQKVENWLVKLNFMRAHDRIDENDSRQLYLDLDSAYSEFNQYLKTKR